MTCFFLCDSDRLLFKELVQLTYITNFIGTELFTLLSCYPFNVCGICSDVIFQFWYKEIARFLFFLVKLAGDWSVLWLFSENMHLESFTFSIDFYTNFFLVFLFFSILQV